MSLHLFEFTKNIASTNLVTLQDGSTQADLHQQNTGLKLAHLDASKTSNWLDVRDVNSILFRFKYVYAAGTTSITFYLQESDSGCLSNGQQNSSAVVYPFPLTAIVVPSTGLATVTGNGQTQVTIPFPSVGASFNAELLIDRLNADYIRLATIAVGGSPTASDTITVTARAKRFCG